MKKILKIANTLLLAFVFSFLLYLYVRQGPQAVLSISMPSILVSLILLVLSFVEITRSARRAYSVKNAPGALLMRMLRHVYSEKTIEEVFEPTQRDFLDEYADAISDFALADTVIAQSVSGTRVFTIYCRYYIAFLRTILQQNVVSNMVRHVFQLIVGG